MQISKYYLHLFTTRDTLSDVLKERATRTQSKEPEVPPQERTLVQEAKG